MIIYSLVMILLAAKLDSPLARKIIYATIGVIGTILLNVTRIFMIAYYGFAYAYTGQQLDAFHNSIGEILFPIWIVAFLALVLHIEGRLAKSERRPRQLIQTDETRKYDKPKSNQAKSRKAKVRHGRSTTRSPRKTRS
jgi:thaumarchaeosortase